MHAYTGNNNRAKTLSRQYLLDILLLVALRSVLASQFYAVASGDYELDH